MPGACTSWSFIMISWYPLVQVFSIRLITLPLMSNKLSTPFVSDSSLNPMVVWLLNGLG